MAKQLRGLILVGIGIIVLGVILFFAQPKDQDHSSMKAEPTGKTLALAIDPQNYDFGTISMKNGLVTKSFKVKNEQDKPISMSEVYTSCMCTNAKVRVNGREFGPFGMLGHGSSGMKMLNQDLAPGQEAELEVIFDPNAHGPSGIGSIERTVTIQSDKGDVANINIKANVEP